MDGFNPSIKTKKSENKITCFINENKDYSFTPKKQKRKYSGYTDSQKNGYSEFSDNSENDLNKSWYNDLSIFSRSNIQRHFKKNENIESKN